MELLEVLTMARFVVFFLIMYLVLPIPRILYILTLRKALKKCAPASLAMDQGLIWLHLVPLAHLVIDCFIVLGMAKSLRNEFARSGINVTDPTPGQAVGLSLCICACCSIIPVLSRSNLRWPCHRLPDPAFPGLARAQVNVRAAPRYRNV